MITDLFTFWNSVGAFIALTWLVRFMILGNAARRRKVLRPTSYETLPPKLPSVSMLVAAKDEEDNIEQCVTTLLAQDYPDLEIIVIDDRSTDRTPAILRRLESGAGGKLRVITITKLRDGWFGKNNAMRAGVEASTGDWLCFTDADCRQTSNRTISVAVAEALRRDVDLLSITPVLETKTAWERIIQPACAALLIAWFRPSRVNSSKTRTAYANGAFMLTRRSCYDAIGGHERVRTEVNEDIQMARHVKDAGLRLRVVENDGLYVTRMYATPREAWRGWSRIFYGSFRTMGRLALPALSVLLSTLVPATMFVVSLVWLIRSPADTVGAQWSTFLVYSLTIALLQLTMWRFYGIVQIARGWSATYVLGAFVVFAMLVNAMLKTLGTTTQWRGTTYRRDALVPDRDETAREPSVTAEPDREATGNV